MSKNALYSQWWNNSAAWDDWRKLAAQCDPYIVSLFAPPAGASWRVVDKCANLLKAAAQPCGQGDGATNPAENQIVA